MTVQLGKFYSLETVESSISCLDIGSVINPKAFGDDGGFEFEEAEPDVNVVVGATGFPTAEFSNNNLVLCTITVPPGSQAYRKIFKQFTDWKAACFDAARLIPVNFSLHDRANGDNITEPAAIWVQRAMPNKMKSKTDQAFVIALPNFKATQEGGVLNITGR